MRFGDERLPPRFWEKVREDESGCWLWTAAIGKPDGYGRFYMDGSMVLAHRLSLNATSVDVLREHQVDHLCRVRNCVNPDHLEAVSPRENNHRSDSPVGRNAKKTHCHRGHPLSGDNVRIYRNGSRVRRCCRECSRINARSYYSRHIEKRRAWAARYREEHREELAARQRDYIARKKAKETA